MEPLVELGDFSGGDDEDVLLRRGRRCGRLVEGDVGLVVVNDVLVAVEGEAVVDVAADVPDGDGVDVGGRLLDFAGERAGGVVEVEQMAVESEQEEEQAGERDKGDGADAFDAPAA